MTKKVEHYECPSYYDDDAVLQDCTCGKCGYESKVNSKEKNMDDTNTGHRNTGHRNSGNLNSGNLNSGNRNSGNRNSGDLNSGNLNSGDWNSGHLNSGNRNSGNRNSGDWNSGDWNSGNWNSGAFNRDEPKMRLFEKELDMTVSEFYEGYNLYADLPLNRWIDKSDMTDKEKSEVEGWKTMGGYLKTLDFKEACRVWWAENPSEHERFLSLPGFEWEIFTDITGIEPDTPEDIEIDGKKFSKSTIKAALKEYAGE